MRLILRGKNATNSDVYREDDNYGHGNVTVYYINNKLQLEEVVRYEEELEDWHWRSEEQAIEELMILCSDILLGTSNSIEWENFDRASFSRERAMKVLQKIENERS